MSSSMMYGFCMNHHCCYYPGNMPNLYPTEVYPITIKLTICGSLGINEEKDELKITLCSGCHALVIHETDALRVCDYENWFDVISEAIEFCRSIEQELQTVAQVEAPVQVQVQAQAQAQGKDQVQEEAQDQAI
jgi:hypothetical protein